MAFAPSPFEQVPTFKWKDIHKKVGQIVVQEPTDSDLQEGSLKTKIWFVDSKWRIYLIAEVE